MLSSEQNYEAQNFESVQCAIDFENTMNELEKQLYYRHLPPKEVALRVMEATQCGLPIEFYFFIKDKVWVNYEHFLTS